MRLDEITVEVRDKQLTRVGLIRPEELRLELTDNFNNVGDWKLQLAIENPLCNALRAPGAGIIITGPNDVIMSGPMVKSEFAATPEDPGGSVSFEGVSDTVALADALAFPDPSNPNGATQTKAHDVRQGTAEDVMHSFVMANIGPTAPVERRRAHLTDGVSLSRGPAVIKSARFPVLGNLLTELALLGSLGFRVVQRGTSLVFETYQITDRSDLVRLDVLNGTLAGQRVAITPPGVTRAIVAGQGELVKRQFLQVQTAQSVAAEADWGRRIEKFIDQRNTDKWDELQQAGDEAMEDAGFTAINVQVVPMEESTMRFGHDWYLGDKVSVVVDSQELKSNVTGMVLKADDGGFRLGALLGDATGFDADAALSKRVTSTEARVSQLERTSDVGAAADNQLMSIMGVY
ncbi:siphovirus ReqiPepy6 Gp37-like family protein [Streptomyces sp. MBT42]|uniref:siphovirus ReqiPepy6 Gp37-like family protein n=1 Tax=Streptomyces sp. MBT42 TaxID=1488373 RepID=UPI001E63F994|nr:siphovirus ReqiPepy6 Gp37-like family protein [Streptomyces sp. MBT42]MCD2462462.1 siphovirus ReqiPepy6 Gp37-like family protein [Streptomyces sp. MBT42]